MVRLDYDVFIFLFAPEIKIIFGISTSYDLRINKIYAKNSKKWVPDLNYRFTGVTGEGGVSDEV